LREISVNKSSLVKKYSGYTCLWLRRLDDDNRSDLNGDNRNLYNDSNRVRGIALSGYGMNKQMYAEVYDFKNLIRAWKRARKGKTKKAYVKEFEEHLAYNLKLLHDELKNESYIPKPLVTFILRDPKTRIISKAEFRDRIVHHALVNILEPIFDPLFIYDSCANRKGKGNLFAIQRFETFTRKVSRNGKMNGWYTNNQIKGYCLKADIKHYFEEVDHEILVRIIKRKISDEKVRRIIEKILENGGGEQVCKENQKMGTRADLRVEQELECPSAT